MNLKDAKALAGKVVIMGFQGPILTPDTSKTITEWGNSRFILFAHNFENSQQLKTLTHAIRQTQSDPTELMISVDQEGGRVQRFKTDFTILPSARTLGLNQSAQATYDQTLIQAHELHQHGIQLNFAPVADINTNPANPVIGDRAYGDDTETVSKHVSAVVRGHLSEKVHPCLKHFPGHGDTHLDSHFALPTVTTPLETLRIREWVPFQRGIKSGARFVMSAHLMLPEIDPNFPGTLSSIFLKTYLRNELNFKGVIVSDDMEMEAITKNFGPMEAPILALQAGCDVLCYRSEAHAIQAMESVTEALATGQLIPADIRASIDRVQEALKVIQ